MGDALADSMRIVILMAMVSAFTLAGCGFSGASSHPRPPKSSGLSLTSSEAARATKILAELRSGSRQPGKSTLLAAFGVGDSTLGTIVSHQPYLELVVSCVGAGSVTLAPVGTGGASPPPLFPPPPRQKTACSGTWPVQGPELVTAVPKVSVPLTLTPGEAPNGPTASTGVLAKTDGTTAVAQPLGAGSVWRDAVGVPMRFRVTAAAGTVWAVVIASSKSGH